MNAKKQWRASVFNDVLDDLRKQRAKIEYAITALEALQNGDIPPTELVEGVLAGKEKRRVILRTAIPGRDPIVVRTRPRPSLHR